MGQEGHHWDRHPQDAHKESPHLCAEKTHFLEHAQNPQPQKWKHLSDLCGI